MLEINRRYLNLFNINELNSKQINLDQLNGILSYRLLNGVELTINLYKEVFGIEYINDSYELKYELIQNSLNKNNLYNIIIYLYSKNIQLIQSQIFPKFNINSKKFEEETINNDKFGLNNKNNKNKLKLLPGDIKPYQYQINNVNTMMYIESLKNKTILFKNPNEANINNQYYFDIKRPQMIGRTRPIKLCYNFYGGLLADKVGLGKTLCCILLTHQDNLNDKKCSWCLINRVKKNKDGKCWYSLRGGPRRGYRCNKKTSDFYCSSHYGSKNIIDYRENMNNISIDENLYNIRDSSYRIKSHANLILCPGYLCEQWKQEIIKYYSNSELPIIITMINKTDFNLLRPNNLMCADFVIVSYNLITSLWYRKYINEYRPPIRDILYFLNNTRPYLHSFKWNRIFLDEFQCIKEPLHWKIINKLYSNYRWCVSGTPMNNNLLYIINFLSHRNSISIETDQALVYLRDNLYIRNTKSFSPKVIEINKWLEFTDKEISMYNTIKSGTCLVPSQINIKLRQFCCNPLTTCPNQNKIPINIMTLEQIHHTLINFQQEQLKSIEEDIKNNNKKNINKLNKKKQTLITGLEYLQKSINNDDNDCPICLDKINMNNRGITKCGHKFCFTCLSRSYQLSTKCPLCNQLLGPDSFYKIDNKINHNNQLEELINNFGTKCGNLIHDIKLFIKNNESIIIFSQWDCVLKQIDNALNKICKINTVWCRGTSNQRIKSIEKFNKSNETKIIMLSSKHTACGTNLTKASVIIFIDPINKNNIQIETQAIARAARIGQTKNIKVIRYFIKNTIEENIYNNFYKNYTFITDE